MDSLFTALDWISGIFVAAIFAMIVLSPSEREAVRWMIGITCAVIILRFTMWAFVTDSTWWIRGLIGALIGALLLVGVPALWRMSKNEPASNPPIAVTPPTVTVPPSAPPANGEEKREQEIQGAQPRPLFDIGGRTRLEITDSRIETPTQGVLRQRDDAQTILNNLSSVDPSSQLVWPNPGGKYSRMPKAKLVDKAIAFAVQLRVIHNEYENATRNKMDLRIAELNVIYEQATAARKASFDKINGECAAVGAALAARQGKQIVPRDQSSIYLGSEAIIRGQLVGIYPVLNAAIALESLASGLR